MSWFKLRRNAAALVLSAGLATGCGFHLQGAGSYPELIATTYIETGDTYSEFYRGLRATLEQGGVDVVDSVVAASAIIRIEDDRTGQRVLTVSSRNVPTEYDVYYTVSYSVWIDGVEVLPSRTLIKRQDYTYDVTEVLGKKREENNLRQAIAMDLVRQVSVQLSRL